MRLSSVAMVGAPGLVAVGFDNALDEMMMSANPMMGSNQAAAVWTSPDGLTWFRVPHDGEVFGGPGTHPPMSSGGTTSDQVSDDEEGIHWPDRQEMNSVVVGGPGLVAVGTGVWTSPDGVSWSLVSDDDPIGGHLEDVTAGGPGLVAVGTGFDCPDQDVEDLDMDDLNVVVCDSDAAVWVFGPG